MAFDFPSSPTTGQTYSVSGGPTYVYNGTAWVVLTPGNQFNRTVFTATAGQTTFTMNYVVGAVDVYRNGVKLVNTSDFTATNGTSIVLLNAATVGDTIEVISYPMITYSDAVKRTGDTMTGALALPSGGLNVGSGQLQIDSSGRVLQGSQPAFFVYLDTGYSTVVSWTKITFSGASNLAQRPSGVLNTSNSRFTAPVSGWYHFHGALNFNDANTDSDGFFGIGVNASALDVSGVLHAGSNMALNGTGGRVFSTVIYLAANDFVELRTYTTAIKTVRPAPWSGYFSGALIG